MGQFFSSRRKIKTPPPPGTAWHEFVWRHGGRTVLLTGSFDDWHPQTPMVRQSDIDEDVFKVCIALDPHKEWQFKFVVDGVWRCSLDYPTVKDVRGNTNNILYPEK